MNQTLDLMYLMREVKILERELTDKELKRREEIAKDLPDDEFKDRYGKDWMSVKMATATKMAKAEELEMDDEDEEDDEDEKRERLKEKAGVSLAKKAKASGIPAGILRQVYNRGVAAWRTGHRPGTNPQQWGNARVNSFISKSKGTWGGADKDLAAKARGKKEEVELGESVVDKVKQVASKKQAMKIDGVMVDTFTASAISQIYDKVNDANKKKMDKLPITKLANLAMKMMQKNEFIPEGVELGEGKMADMLKFDKKGMSSKDIAKKLGMDEREVKAILSQPDHVKRAMLKLDEGKMSQIDQMRKDGKSAEEIAKAMKMKVKDIKKIMGEEVELGEDGHADVASAIRQCKTVMEDAQQIMAKLQTMSPEDSLPTWWTNKFAVASNSMNKMRDYIVNPLGEALDKKDEPTVKRIVGKLKKASQAHAGQAKDLEKAMDEDAVETAKDKIAKEKETDKKKHDKMMDRARIQQARQKNMETEEVDMKTVSSMMEQSARADARRAMRRDPEMKQKGFSKDMSATDDDKKAASKNIMVQMRKAQSLRGKFEVEFADGKKVRIPEKVAVAVQQKFNAMRKPADKEKFQAKVAKSYKDMLRALKEESDATPDYKAGGKAKAAEYTAKAKQMVGAEGFASDAQRRAAFAQGYKAKGKKNKKESVLDRIDSKLKEIKNG
jgi:DNA-binding CsgD family transcriptional regulator